LNFISLRLWRIPLGRPSVVMTNPSIGMSLLRIGRENTSPDFRGRDLDHPNIRIRKEVLSSAIRAEVCANKIFHLRVGIGQQRK